VTQHLERLKKQVVNLNKENARLQGTNPEGDSGHNTSRDGNKIEELEAQRQSSEERIKDHSLYIQKLEKKVNDLVNQCQGLMRINHEMSTQIMQMSHVPLGAGLEDSQPFISQFDDFNQKLQQFVEDKQILTEENEKLREVVLHLESQLLHSNNGNEPVGDLIAKKSDGQVKREQVRSISFRGDSAPNSATEKPAGGIKLEVDNLKGIINSFRSQLKDPQSENSQYEHLLEENKRLKEELEKKDHIIRNLQEQQDRPTIGDVDVSIQHYGIKDGYKSLREVVKEPLSVNNSIQEGIPKTSRDKSEPRATTNNTELLKKQLGDYKSANVILHKKAEKYLLQIEDLNGALKQANENLDALQNKYITLEKELINKNKLESILNTHINLMKKLETKIYSLTEENALLQQANEENLVVITELKSQLEEGGGLQTYYVDAESGTKFTTPPRSSRRYSDSRPSYLSPCRSPDTIALEREIINKKCDEKVKKVHHEHDMTIRAERIKHKNQIEKYNMNMDVLSRKIQALVAVNEDLGKEFEMLKVEFTNYRTLSWSIVQEIKKYLENFKKHDDLIERGISEYAEIHDFKAQELQNAYERLKSDILNINDVIEERRKFM